MLVARAYAATTWFGVLDKPRQRYKRGGLHPWVRCREECTVHVLVLREFASVQANRVLRNLVCLSSPQPNPTQPKPERHLPIAGGQHDFNAITEAS